VGKVAVKTQVEKMDSVKIVRREELVRFVLTDRTVMLEGMLAMAQTAVLMLSFKHLDEHILSDALCLPNFSPPVTGACTSGGGSALL
jgi:hypothetical protein